MWLLRTWGNRVGPVPDTDYWPSVIPAVRQAHPGFLFLAEANWDLDAHQHGLVRFVENHDEPRAASVFGSTRSQVAAMTALTQAVADPTFRLGGWHLCDRSGWPGDDRYQNLVAWCWEGDSRWLIVVNLSDGTAAGLLRAPWDDLRGRHWQLTDPTQNSTLLRSGDDLVDGLFVDLDAWRWHMFGIDEIADEVA
jgi:hypothetical protein